MRSRASWIAAGICVVASWAAAASCARRDPAAPPGDVAAAVAAAPRLAPATFDLHGKAALVMFVSASCVHCLKEVPIAQDVARDAGAASAIVFVSGARPNALSFLQQTHFMGPALYDDGTLKRQYDITAVPYTLALAADGHATAAFIGEQDADTLRDALTSRGR